MKDFFKALMLVYCIFHLNIKATSQNPDDTEFKKGWIFYLKLDNGVVSNFHSAPDLFTGGMLLNPQVTLIENKFRIGVNTGFAYTGKKINGLIGPTLAFKIKTFNLKNLGSMANLQLIAEHNWGSEKQRLVGGGVGFEVLQKILLILTTHRDYKLKNWWIQWHLGINLKKNRNKTPEFNQ